jgi:hypothetical protein
VIARIEINGRWAERFTILRSSYVVVEVKRYHPRSIVECVLKRERSMS